MCSAFIFLYMEDGFYKLEKMIDKVSIEEIKKYIDIEEKMTENLKDGSDAIADWPLLVRLRWLE